jgi:hypothetical protein
MSTPALNMTMSNMVMAAPTLVPSVHLPNCRFANQETNGLPIKLSATAARKNMVSSLKRHTKPTKDSPAIHHSHRILLMASSQIWV